MKVLRGEGLKWFWLCVGGCEMGLPRWWWWWGGGGGGGVDVLLLITTLKSASSLFL